MCASTSCFLEHAHTVPPEQMKAPMYIVLLAKLSHTDIYACIRYKESKSDLNKVYIISILLT